MILDRSLIDLGCPFGDHLFPILQHMAWPIMCVGLQHVLIILVVQEAKDQLLVETADMLHIPLFTAEALLRDNEWSREVLLDRWMKNPVECCTRFVV